jgi:hypothetical protein
MNDDTCPIIFSDRTVVASKMCTTVEYKITRCVCPPSALATAPTALMSRDGCLEVYVK